MKSIIEMTADELNEYEQDLWATYYELPMKEREDIQDIRLTLRLIGRVQQRRKEMTR